MLIDSDEVQKRLNNPLNLMNRMRAGLTAPKRTAMDLFVKKNPEGSGSSESVQSNPASLPAVVIPASVAATDGTQVSSDDLIDDFDAKVKLAAIEINALDLLNNSITNLADKVNKDNVKTSSIPAIISSASRVITDIRKERLEREKNNKNENVHYHFYCPTQRKIEDYDVIEVTQ